MDPEGGSSEIFPMDPLVPRGLGVHFLSRIASFVDNSRYLYVPGSLALEETFNFISKFAGALLVWLSSGSNSNFSHRISSCPDGSHPSNFKSNTPLKHVSSCGQNFIGFFCDNRARSSIPFMLCKISKFSIKRFCKDAEHLRSLPFLSLAAALVPPFENVSPDVLAVPLDSAAIEAQRCMNQRPCKVEHQGCGDISFQCLSWSRHAIEPRTGIEFPTILENMVMGDDNSNFTSEGPTTFYRCTSPSAPTFLYWF